MSEQELLAENRAMNWMQIPESAPQWVRSHIVECRKAALGKRELSPAYLRKYSQEAEQRSLAAFARAGRAAKKFVVPILTRQVDVDAANRRRAKEIAEQIRRDEPLEQTRKRIDAIMRSSERQSEKVLCPASSVVADRQQHLAASEFHTVCGRSAKTLAVGTRHFAAADAHRLAAENPTSTNKIAAVAACKACEVDDTRFQMVVANK